jgi:hypothetical protein
MTRVGSQRHSNKKKWLLSEGGTISGVDCTFVITVKIFLDNNSNTRNGFVYT